MSRMPAPDPGRTLPARHRGSAPPTPNPRRAGQHVQRYTEQFALSVRAGARVDRSTGTAIGFPVVSSGHSTHTDPRQRTAQRAGRSILGTRSEPQLQGSDMLRRVVCYAACLYLLFAAFGRFVEAMGVVRCGCSPDCWCQRPVLNIFGWVSPLGHQPTQTVNTFEQGRTLG